MRAEEAQLLRSVAAAARELPRTLIDELCDELERLPADPTARQRAALTGAAHSLRGQALITRLATAWELVPHVSSASIAWGLRAASAVDDQHRNKQSVELVWTGPVPFRTALRRTDQVLLDLIRTAQRSLYMVTFAAYKIPVLNEAMLEAAQRGVEISLIFESPGASAGKTAFAGLDALDDELKALSEVYFWPLDRRPRDQAGRYGSLHAKFAVADEAALFVSSANLTEYAFNFNMELGLLVRGGNLPPLVVGQIRQLIEEAVLVPTPGGERE